MMWNTAEGLCCRQNMGLEVVVREPRHLFRGSTMRNCNSHWPPFSTLHRMLVRAQISEAQHRIFPLRTLDLSVVFSS